MILCIKLFPYYDYCVLTLVVYLLSMFFSILMNLCIDLLYINDFVYLFILYYDYCVLILLLLIIIILCLIVTN